MIDKSEEKKENNTNPPSRTDNKHSWSLPNHNQNKGDAPRHLHTDPLLSAVVQAWDLVILKPVPPAFAFRNWET